MRYFLITLLACLSWFSGYSQEDTLVCIKPDVARFFLEKNEELKVYKKRDSLNQQLVTNLNDQLLNKDRIIQLDSSEIEGLKLINVTYSDVITYKNKEIEGLERQNKLLKIVGVILLGLLIVL